MSDCDLLQLMSTTDTIHSSSFAAAARGVFRDYIYLLVMYFGTVLSPDLTTLKCVRSLLLLVIRALMTSLTVFTVAVIGSRNLEPLFGFIKKPEVICINF